MTSYDVIIVGYGAAGASAAIEAADAGARVLVLDRGWGGGASGLSGGVVYAGGGTTVQREAGEHDSPQNMYNYLRQEVRGFVSDQTLRRFCHVSAQTITWLEKQGAVFRGALCPYKTSYPTDRHYLYYSGNEQAWPYNTRAEPAARGHRMVARGLSSGHALMAALMKTAAAKGVVFRPQSRVHSLIICDGKVAGVRYRGADTDTGVGGDFGARHRRLSRYAGKFGNWVPAIGRRLGGRAEALWEANAVEREAHGKTVILSAGGFVFNRQMMKEHFTGAWLNVGRLGTAGDDGTAIGLGRSAGGTVGHMDRMTAWRFISPPSGFLQGVAVGPRGERIANEDLYGATHSEIMINSHDGVGHVIMDRRQWRKARRQVPGQTMAFQRLIALFIFTAGHKKDATLEGLARKTGLPAQGLAGTVRAYNDGITSGAGDPAHKAPGLCSPIEHPPFYSFDISIRRSSANPVVGLTIGGLRVNEETGELLDTGGRPIPRIYAAGRSAVGICSNSYVSGLSLADCVFSGRRAGVHAAATAQAESVSL